MHIYILVCIAAVLTVTQLTPITITHNDAEDEGIISEKVPTDIQNRADFVAVKIARSKRQGHGTVNIPVGQAGSGTYGVGVYHNNGVPSGAGVYYSTPIDGGCLYGDDFVLLQDGSSKQLKNLRSGDKVYSVDKQDKLVKDEIIMMLHGGPKVETRFYTLTTSSNQTISLTAHHLIMKYSPQEKRSQIVAANELKTGDYLMMGDKRQTEPISIVSIEVLYKTGIYTPMTYTGTLLVNNIAVSCYVKHFNKYNELHTLLYPLRFYYYLLKDIFQLSEEPFSTVSSLVYGNEEFYGTRMIKWLHQSKNMIRYVGQDLLFGSLLSV